MSGEIQQIIQDIEESLDKNKWNIDHITVNNNTIIISLQHIPSSDRFKFKVKMPKEPKNNYSYNCTYFFLGIFLTIILLICLILFGGPSRSRGLT
jgi:hypothetical protein